MSKAFVKTPSQVCLCLAFALALAQKPPTCCLPTSSEDGEQQVGGFFLPCFQKDCLLACLPALLLHGRVRSAMVPPSAQGGKCNPAAIALGTPPFCVCRVVVRTRMYGPGAARPFRLKR
jgi:hypothetical protein